MLIFENLNRDFGKLGIGRVQIGLQIWTCRLRIRLYANFGKLLPVLFLSKITIGMFFCHPVDKKKLGRLTPYLTVLNI